jgi:hypothetical protein
VTDGAEMRIPLPVAASLPCDEVGAGCARVVASFLERTKALSCEAAAELAGVRPETIRGWRGRLPRWLKASTARRLAEPASGNATAPPNDGFRVAFRRILRDHPPG